jgi:hypothetical protein
MGRPVGAGAEGGFLVLRRRAAGPGGRDLQTFPVLTPTGPDGAVSTSRADPLGRPDLVALDASHTWLRFHGLDPRSASR